MIYPVILSYAQVAHLGSLTVPVGTKLIICAQFANQPATLGGVSMPLITNYSTFASLRKYILPPSGNLVYASSGSPGWFYCLGDAYDAGASRSGANASGLDSFSLAGIGASLVIGLQTAGTTTTAGHHLTVDGADMTYDYNSTYYQLGHKASSSILIPCTASDANAGGVVQGDSFVVIPYRAWNMGNCLMWI